MIAFGNFAKLILTGLLLLAFTWTGFYFGVSQSRQAKLASLFESTTFAGSSLSTLDSAARGKSLSLATGRVENNIEALYGLDHLTGNLFCWILNPSSGEIAAEYQFNVKQALGVAAGEADYVLTTGFMDFSIQKTGSVRTAQSVAYIGEGNSGKVVGILLWYDRQALSRGEAGSGELQLISSAMTRAAGARRDQ